MCPYKLNVSVHLSICGVFIAICNLPLPAFERDRLTYLAVNKYYGFNNGLETENIVLDSNWQI